MSSNKRPSVPRKTPSAATPKGKPTAVEPYRVSDGAMRCRVARTFMRSLLDFYIGDARLGRGAGWCNRHKAILWLVGLRADLSAPLALLCSRSRKPRAAMNDAFLNHVRATLGDIEAAGLTKRERLLTGPQGGRIHVASPQGAREAVNLCANNYLGLADHPDVIAAARRAMDEFGFGMASVRFICGAQTLHRELEQAIAKHLGKDDAIVFAACFDANGGVFEPLLGDEDAIISHSLKEADAANARFKLIATDGVFSMDGYVAKLKEICELADRYGALVLVDDCHATGHLGEKGRGTPALTGAGDRVNIVTGTFGKTLGGGMGGFVAADQPIVDLLRQRARPYLFSNSLAPPLAAGALKALEIAIGADARRALLKNHA